MAIDSCYLCITSVNIHASKIELRKNNGSLIREMNLNAIYAKWYNENILITTKNNKNELRNINGSLIKIY